MIASRIPFSMRDSRQSRACSSVIGLVFRSIRGEREKIWIASQPIHLPALAAFGKPPSMEQCAPRSIGGLPAREPPHPQKGALAHVAEHIWRQVACLAVDPNLRNERPKRDWESIRAKAYSPRGPQKSGGRRPAR